MMYTLTILAPFARSWRAELLEHTADSCPNTRTQRRRKSHVFRRDSSAFEILVGNAASLDAQHRCASCLSTVQAAVVLRAMLQQSRQCTHRCMCCMSRGACQAFRVVHSVHRDASPVCLWRDWQQVDKAAWIAFRPCFAASGHVR
jgi:hypothetical protein